MFKGLSLAFLFQINVAVASSDITYPVDAGIIDVANPPTGFAAAVPNDGVDDTSAINALLSAYNGQTNGQIHVLASRVIYFPAGVYNISDTLVARIDGQTASSVAFSGAGCGRTVFRLEDGAEGFDDMDWPKPLIELGKMYIPDDPREIGPDGAFGNLVRNLSIELGNNPGAVGVFVALANMGQVHDISVTAQEAFAGLVTYDRAGAGLIRNVAIENCDYGIYQLWDYDAEYYMQFPGHSQSDQLTMEHLTITDYAKSGIYNCAKNYVMRDVLLSSGNAAGPAIYLGFQLHPAQVEALDLRIYGNPVHPGIEVAHDDVFLYLRDARIEDCSIAVDLLSGVDNTNSVIKEFSTHSMISRCRPGSELTLRLPVKETPEYIPQSNDWTRTTMNPTNSPEANCQALQSDIDQCATPVLYIPYGQYSLDGEVVISNTSLKMIKGFFPYLIGAPLIRVCASNSILMFEDLVISPNHRIIQESNNPLVFRNIGVGPKIQNLPGARGDIFIENIGAHPQVGVCDGINVYMRQFNREKMAVVNDGAVIWCLGENIESMGEPDTAPWTTKNGGVSEIIGASFDAGTDGALEEVAQNYLYEIEDDASRFSVMGTGMFVTNVNSGWDLMIKDAAITNYMVNGYDADYDIRLYSGSAYGRMVVPPFIIDRRNLAFYPMEDVAAGSKVSWFHLADAEPSSIVQVSKFGFVDRVFSNDINGVSKNINTIFLEDVGLALDNFCTNYCEFSVGPSGNCVMNISGISLQVAGENNDYGDSFTFRVYVTTDGNEPEVLGWVDRTVEDGTCAGWETFYIDLSDRPEFQALTERRTFRLYMRANARHWRCIGLFDNVTVHGTCDKPLVKFDFETSLQPSFQDAAAQGLTAFEGRLRQVNNLGLALQNGAARVLSCQTLDSLHDAVTANRYLEFTLQASEVIKPLNLKALKFDWSAVQLGSFGPLDCILDVQISEKGFGEYQSVAQFEKEFSDTSATVPIVVDLDCPAFQNLTNAVSVRIYISDNQFSYLYRPAIDNLSVYGTAGP